MSLFELNLGSIEGITSSFFSTLIDIKNANRKK